MTASQETHDDELAYLPAREVLRRFRCLELSPIDYLDYLIERIEELDSFVNCICHRYWDTARERAERASVRYRRGRNVGALEGLPVAVKEESHVAGQATTDGSLLFQEQVASSTDPAIARILQAGGIVFARTTAPEFSCVGFTHSRLWGVTRNPWNLSFDPGGSSGGSAAALASGFAPLATGSDIAGSIRIPASACGVVGFKPSFGRVPQTSPYNLDHYCHEGPLGRYVADCAYLFSLTAGQWDGDITSLPFEMGEVDVDRLPVARRLIVSYRLGDFDVDASVHEVVERAVDAVAREGVECVVREPRWSRGRLQQALWSHLALFGHAVEKEIGGNEELVTDYVLEFVERSRRVGLRNYLETFDVEAEAYRLFMEIVGPGEVLVCPTMTVPAFEAGKSYVGHGPMVNRKQTESWVDGVMTYPFNLLGRCPVVTLRAGVAENGVPVGIQVVGRPYQDWLVLGTAGRLEAMLQNEVWPSVALRRGSALFSQEGVEAAS
jgi:Asp-tRNA(Asn)/Glu-tRNA(Gln) amidotransferase A subunit family amidase